MGYFFLNEISINHNTINKEVIFLKLIKRCCKALFVLCFAAAVLLFSAIIYLDMTVEDDIKIKKGSALELETALPVTAEYNGLVLSQKSIFEKTGEEYEIRLKLLGIIPVSSVKVQVVDELEVRLLGMPFGMKLYTEGVLIIDLTEVKTKNGIEKPAERAGLKKGDYIVSVNGNPVRSNEEFSFVIENCQGQTMTLGVKRDKTTLKITVKPVLSDETNSYKLGIWIRDSSAGIGTLTFYSPANDVLCGLGHGICDEDTGELMTVETGEMVFAEIVGVVKGESGAPGQLKGTLTNKVMGEIENNCELGVYSKSKKSFGDCRLVDIALRQEVKEGKAYILCTVDGDSPKLYSCDVKIRSSSFYSKTQNLVVTVTDEELIEKTGGIVQGMSGSPIIQNGKLIGAVTHVLIDEPTKGYGIFAENMLETAQGVADNKLKDAS